MPQSLIQSLLPNDIILPLGVRMVASCLIAFLLVIVAGPRVIRELIALKIGQPIRSEEEVHQLAKLHGAKMGTPTMGGILILASTLLSVILFAKWNIFLAVSTVVMLLLGVLGFWDDYLKVTKKTSDGVSARFKLVFQWIVGLGSMSVLYFYPGADIPNSTSAQVSQLFIPFYGSIDIGWFCILFGALVLVSASNAVNLTDGLDGLAAGSVVSTGGAYAFIAALAGTSILPNCPHHPMAIELSILMSGIIGSCLGFLWFNCYPAKVFMGDTGSLALGGALGMVAICTTQEILFIVIGGIFVTEATSVVLQVASFKSRGKRIFRMAPIHHHFELGGWKETQVIVRFWIVGLFLAIAGITCLGIQ